MSHWVLRTFAQCCTTLGLIPNCVARISKVAKWCPPLYACVVWPWECCKTRLMWSCNVVLALHITYPLVYMAHTSKLFFDRTWLSREKHGCYYTARIDQCIYSQAQVRAQARWLAWSYVRRTSNRINARSVVRSPDYSYDAVASSYNTRFCCTTNVLGHKTYCKIYYISLHNARLMGLQIVRAFVRATDCKFLRSHDFLVASAHATIVKAQLEGPKVTLVVAVRPPSTPASRCHRLISGPPGFSRLPGVVVTGLVIPNRM